MTKITFWTIRHKPTGYMLPVAKGRDGRGGSHVEPVEPSVDTRLFRSERAAKGFLTTWLKGKVVAERGMDPGHPGNDWESEYYEDLKTVPVPTRKREEMEVATMVMKLRKTK